MIKCERTSPVCFEDTHHYFKLRYQACALNKVIRHATQYNVLYIHIYVCIFRYTYIYLFVFDYICTAKSVCIESDIAHDYAEIYTPSREKLPWDKSNKPPTPPLHRFPSWESRIYQVANEGLSTAPTSQVEPHTASAAGIPNSVHPTRVVTSQGYCDISVPVYATVKGVSAVKHARIHSLRPTRTWQYIIYIFVYVFF